MSVIFAMCLFSLSMSISPGPVNFITLSTGINHGFRSAIPFVSGATIGFTLLLLMLGLGMGSFASQSRIFLDLLGYGGSAFIFYMGYKIVTSNPEVELPNAVAPVFSQGFLLQWLNPKAWIACISGVSAFELAESLPMLITFVSLYFVICYASIASWALAGDKIKSLLAKPRRLRILNSVMGTVLIAIAVYLMSVQFAIF